MTSSPSMRPTRLFKASSHPKRKKGGFQIFFFLFFFSPFVSFAFPRVGFTSVFRVSRRSWITRLIDARGRRFRSKAENHGQVDESVVEC